MKIVKARHIKNNTGLYYQVSPSMNIAKGDILVRNRVKSIDDKIVIAESEDFEVDERAFEIMVGFKPTSRIEFKLIAENRGDMIVVERYKE